LAAVSCLVAPLLEARCRLAGADDLLRGEGFLGGGDFIAVAPAAEDVDGVCDALDARGSPSSVIVEGKRRLPPCRPLLSALLLSSPCASS
jgi:hypothetical protein